MNKKEIQMMQKKLDMLSSSIAIDATGDLIKIVDIFFLKSKRRQREIIDRRCYIYHELYSNGIPKAKIARYFDLGSASIINGLKKYEYNKNNQDFKENIQPIINFLKK